MLLAPMRFKDYTWPHNPEAYTVEYRRRVAALPVPGGGCVMQELGGAYRVMRGEGVFAGEGAYEEFLRLAEVFRKEGPGLLIHPVWPAEQAYFVELQAAEEPLPDYVRYTFTFWEDWTGYRADLTENDDGGTAPWTGNAASNAVSAGETETGPGVLGGGTAHGGPAAWNAARGQA